MPDDTIELEICTTCDGTGQVEDEEDGEVESYECPDCEGSGYEGQ